MSVRGAGGLVGADIFQYCRDLHVDLRQWGTGLRRGVGPLHFCGGLTRKAANIPRLGTLTSQH